MDDTAQMMTTATLALLAYLFVTCALRTLAARVQFDLQRHDLIIASKRRRLEYLRKTSDKEDDGEIVVEPEVPTDTGPVGSIGDSPEPMRRAA